MNNPDLRYHVASLSAIFLSLGIGIVIGTAFVGSPLVVKQTGMLHRLETHVSELREESRERERTEEALAQVAAQTVRDVLKNKRVLVVQTGDYPDAALAAREALELSGATVVSVTLPPDAWRGKLGKPDVTPEAIEEQARQLSLVLATGAPVPEAFREDGLIVGEAGGVVRFVVLVGGEKNGGNTALLAHRDTPLIVEWKNAGLTVVGVEPRTVNVSYLPTYRSQEIATVDAINYAAGRIALPFALLQNKPGAFGYRADADRVLPESAGVAPSPSPSPTVAPLPPATTLP
ncbi:MAG: copper transporter [Armatimonadetes bacterium]|nr:copper transporter [Armatimonadota bacterium]